MNRGKLWPSAVPNEPTIACETGLSQRLSYFPPEFIPLGGISALNGPSTTVDYELVGAPRLLYRNVLGYPYHLPDTRRQYMRMQPYTKYGEAFAHVELQRLDKRYKTYLTSFLPEVGFWMDKENKMTALNISNRSDRQGNALAKLSTDDFQYLWAPTGENLEHIHCFRRSNKSKKDQKRWTRYAPSKSTINKIKQLQTFANIDKPMAVARGDCNATITAVCNDTYSVQVIEELKFKYNVQHVACSPHVSAEAMFLTSSFELFTWTPDGGLLSMGPRIQEQWKRMEFSNHPCVLWIATKDSIGTYDTRQRSPNGYNLDWIYNLHGASTIYDIQRHPSCPFQFVVRTGLSLEVFDTRNSNRSVMHWAHDNLYPQTEAISDYKEPISGTLDIVDVSSNCKRQALLLSGTSVLNCVCVHSYHVRSNAMEMQQLEPLLQPTINSNDVLFQPETGMAPFDVHLPDSTYWIYQVGALGLSNLQHPDQVDIIQLSSVGDIFIQHIAQSSQEEVTIQNELPCGITANREHSKTAHLPLQYSAFMPSYDSSSICRYSLIDASKANEELSNQALHVYGDPAENTDLIQYKELRRHFRVVKPSCTLHTLRDTWVIRPKCRVLIDSLRASGSFYLHMIKTHDRYKYTTRKAAQYSLKSTHYTTQSNAES
ncbi:hypothetical protein THRCLA_05825, partial [Thraustotheca clavata]